jgi:carbonic anhydrase
MDLLRPGYARLPEGTEAERVAALEKQAVLVSLENLMSFPYVKEAVEEGKLTLHGLWTDIGAGGLECYDSDRGDFVPV